MRNVILILALAVVSHSAMGKSLDERCKEIMVEKIDQIKSVSKETVILTNFDGFYSKKLDTCIMTMANPITHHFDIKDSALNFQKDAPDLFHCDADQYYYSDFEKVRKYNGYIAHQKYGNWSYSDDRSKPEQIKHTPSECQQRFESMVEKIR